MPRRTNAAQQVVCDRGPHGHSKSARPHQADSLKTGTEKQSLAANGMPNARLILQNVVIQHPAVDVLEVLTLENLTFRRGIITVKSKN